MVDPVQMEQVLMNLVVNAHEAMPEGGRILILTDDVSLEEEQCRKAAEARPGRFVRVRVKDDGTGVEPGVLEHIFEPFFSTRDSGSGLGLALVYGIVTQHEGWVEVNSVPMEGTTFSIFLPRFAAAPVSEPQKPKSLHGMKGRGERVLLVEDEEGVRGYATRVLSENGYTVFAAASVGEALQLYSEERGRFSIVFSDQVLPGRSGLELVEELRQRDPSIGVLLTSGYAGKESSRKQIEDRGYPFLRKPYGTMDILVRIRQVLDGEE
jgi:CheY-like chemotaxis protein